MQISRLCWRSHFVLQARHGVPAPKNVAESNQIYVSSHNLKQTKNVGVCRSSYTTEIAEREISELFGLSIMRRPWEIFAQSDSTLAHCEIFAKALSEWELFLLWTTMSDMSTLNKSKCSSTCAPDLTYGYRRVFLLTQTLPGAYSYRKDHEEKQQPRSHIYELIETRFAGNHDRKLP